MHGRKNNMIELNSNIVNISLLKCVIDELPTASITYSSYDDVMNKIEDIKETLKEVIESLENKG
tara:strand:- start:9 stop:200 length:192 start_codon:yes stop_codon:yes gene_type:complete